MRAFFTLIFCLSCVFSLGAADEKPRGPGGGKQGGPRGPQRPPGPDSAVDDVRSLFKTDVPARSLDILLGRPAATSVTVSIVSYQSREGMLEYGTKGEPSEKRPSSNLPQESRWSFPSPG